MSHRQPFKRASKDSRDVSSLKITDIPQDSAGGSQALQVIGLKNSIESNQIKIDKGVIQLASDFENSGGDDEASRTEAFQI